MKLAVSNIAWTPEERRDVYDVMAETGVTGLEIAPGLFFHAAEDPFSPSEDVARAALAEIAERADAGFDAIAPLWRHGRRAF